MVSISSALIQGWVIALIWPLTRILAMVSTAPIFGHNAIPKRIKLGVGIVITLVIMPTIPEIPPFDVFSFQGLLILIQQMLIGIAIGFTMRLFLSAVEIAGQLIGMSMGLGFASFFDPQSQGQTIAISQFLMLLCMLVFLSLDGHLMLVSVVSHSFVTMPIGVAGSIDAMKVANWGAEIFSIGLLLALPCVAALLIINMALGILTRTAPQLNLFGIGFPVTLSMGFLILALALPGMLKPLEQLIWQGLQNVQMISAAK